MSDDLIVVLEYRSANRSAIQNWRGPGWYVHASTTDNHGTFAIEPRRILPVESAKIATAFGTPVLQLATQQQDRGRAELAARIAQLESIEANLSAARNDLAEFDRAAEDPEDEEES